MTKGVRINGKRPTSRSATNGTGSAKRPGATKRVVAAPFRVSSLDANAAAYAKLIADPCKAPLTNPVYSGGEGGYLVRSDAWNSYGIGAGNTSGILHWTPGYMCATHQEHCYTAAAASGTAAVVATSGNVPGKDFLTATAGAIRCVAACIRVTFSGSESARSGRVHLGHTSGIHVIPGASVSADAVANSLPNFMRTPPTELELIWKPNDADQLFVNPNAAFDGNDRARRSALTMAFAELPAGVGLTVHMTAVYEWQPKNNQGISNPSQSRNKSNNTLDQVISYLEKNGETWLRSASQMGGSIGAIAGMMGGTYGMIPAIAGAVRRGFR